MLKKIQNLAGVKTLNKKERSKIAIGGRADGLYTVTCHYEDGTHTIGSTRDRDVALVMIRHCNSQNGYVW